MIIKCSLLRGVLIINRLLRLVIIGSKNKPIRNNQKTTILKINLAKWENKNGSIKAAKLIKKILLLLNSTYNR